MEREQIYRVTNSGKIIPVGELVRCKDCKHRPTKNPEFEQILEFPDGVCPCQNPDDDYYSWYPGANWYCADGERKDGDGN